MGDGDNSVSALAHFASCASVSHVSSLRPSSDIVHSPFLGLCGTDDVRDEDRRKSGGANPEGAARGRRARLPQGQTVSRCYRFRDGATSPIKVPTPDARAAASPCQLAREQQAGRAPPPPASRPPCP